MRTPYEDLDPGGMSGEDILAAARTCRAAFSSKFEQYGYSWQVLRVESLLDRILTKASRIRQLEALKAQSVAAKIAETAEVEYVGVVNYGIMVFDRLSHEGLTWPNPHARVEDRWSNPSSSLRSYDAAMARALLLLRDKNHDYGDAWLHLRQTTITDEILVRTGRANSLLSHAEQSIDSVLDQVVDMINYGLFAVAKEARLRKQVDNL